MGSDKALLDVNGRPMALVVADALTVAGCRPVLLVGGEPVSRAHLGIEHVTDRHPGEGPLGGVVTTLGQVARDRPAAEWVLVAACDLPGVTESSLRRMIATAATCEADVVVARAERAERVQPALALWRVRSADRVARLFDGGVRALGAALDTLGYEAVDVGDDELVNINTPDDLHRYPGTS